MIFSTKNKELAILGQTLSDVKKKLIDFNDIWMQGGRFGFSKPQLIPEEKIIKEFSLDEAEQQLKSLNQFVVSGKMTYEQYFNTIGKGNTVLKTYVTTTDQQSQSVQGLIKASQNARAVQIAHNEQIKNMTLSAKAGKVALQALVTVGNMFAMWAITKGIELAVTSIDNLIHSAEHCKERVDELMSSYQSALSEANSNAQTVEELASKYEELSKGVNSLGENVSLTTDEYAEYNKIVNQIADMFPNLIQGYTNEGNAILSLKGNVEELRNAYKEAQQEAYNMLIVSGKDSNGNDIIDNFQNTMHNDGALRWDSSAKEYVDIITELYNAMLGSEQEYQKLYKDMTSLYSSYNKGRSIAQILDIQKVLKEIGFTSELSDEDKKNIANNARSYIQTYQAEVDSALKNVQTLANAYLMTNEDYAKLDEQSKNAASIIVNSINEHIASGFAKQEDVGAYVANIVDTIKDNPEVQDALVGLFSTDLSTLSPQQAKELVDQYIKCIAEALGEDELELKIRLGFEDTDTIARNYNTVMQKAAEKFSGVSGVRNKENWNNPDDFADYEKEKAALEAFAEENSINTQDEIAFWNQCIEESETKEEAMEKYLASAFTGDMAESVVPDITSSISTIATQLEPQFTELGKLYNEIFTTDGFTLNSVDNTALESLRKSFAEIEKEIGVTFDPEKLEPFFAVLTDGSSTADNVQSAFNDLATAYLYSTGTLEQLNNETANAIEKQLEQMGVTNAEAVVAEALRVKGEELALSKKYLALEGKELAEATNSEVLAFMRQEVEAGNCGDALVTLQLKKLLANGTILSTEEDINNVMSFAKAVGISTTALSEFIMLKAELEKAEANVKSAPNEDKGKALKEMADVMGRMTLAQKQFEDDVNNFELAPVDIEFNAPNAGKSSSSSSAAKQAETDWKNVLDKETDLLEKQLAANVITFKEYTDKRRQIIEDYYRDGKIKAEDYYDALEDMYDHQLSLYDRAVNAVTDRIDDEIDKLKDQKEEIEKSYQVRIDAIQEEIDALNKTNNARQKQIDLEKAQYEAERARNQRVNKIYDGEQFTYEADMENVRDVEDDLADKEFQLNISRLETQIELLKEEMENATKSLDNQINALEAYKDKWNEISGAYQEQQDKLLAAEIMGSEWERDVLNGRLDTLQSFTEQYIALQQAQADAAVNAARIKAEAEAGNATGGNVNPGGNGNDTKTSRGDDGGAPSTYDVVYEGTAKTVRTFNTPEEAQSYANYMNKVHRNDEFMYYVKKYASGTDHARKGLNLVGEDGTETFIDNDGNVSLVTRPTLIPMEGGEVVKNAEETKAMLDTDNLELVSEKQSAEMQSLLQRIRNMPLSDFNFQSIMKPLESVINRPNIEFSPVLNGSESINIVQNNTINCPNVTNNSGAEYILKSLERLPLDNIQHSHRRRY